MLNFFFWSAEAKFWKRACNKYNLTQDLKINNWVDLHKTFITEKIVVKGSLTYSLKSIANAMRKHGFINSNLDGFLCKTGLDAMLSAEEFYNKNNVNYKNLVVLEEIIEYNNFDVMVLQEIFEYLRKYVNSQN